MQRLVTILLALTALAAAACSREVRATASLEPKSGSQATGSATFTEKDGNLEVTVTASGLSPGKHGIHIHEKPDCSASDGSSAGPHFNPGSGQHGGPIDPNRHAGDLGNLQASPDGKASQTFKSDALTLSGEKGVVGRSLAIHGDPDDFTTQPSGNSGSIVACGPIKQE
jgi:Cu-Zn family superoxide dismutase